MAEIKPILVNGKQYKVQTLSVLDTIDLHVDAVESFGETIGKYFLMIADAQSGKVPSNEEMASVFNGLKSEKIKPFKKRILAQVVTPENKFLSDEMVIEDWFSRPENKQDVWEVLIKATQELLGEYLPNFLRDMANQGLEKATAGKLKSQENSEPRESSISH